MTKKVPLRHVLTVNDLSDAEIDTVLSKAVSLKEDLKNNVPHRDLDRKLLVLLFQKPSLRTRASFEIAMKQLGGDTLSFLPQEVGLGKREAPKDVARVLSRYADMIMLRTFEHSLLEELKEYSTVPVINGLSNEHHPCQVLPDMMTIYEQKWTFDNLKLCFIGDGNNVCRSLALISRRLNISMVLSCPKGYEINEPGLDVEHDPKKAVQDVDIVYTDVWTSMGKEDELEQHLNDFKNYMVTADLLKLAKPDGMFLHCLPAHRGEEVTDEVMEGPQSYVFDQAENRLHIQKAIMLSLLNGF